MNEINTSEEQKKSSNLKIEQILFYCAPVITFLIAFGLAFLPIWQLSLIAGIIGGAFYLKFKQGALAGTIGVGLGWSLYIIIKVSTTNLETLIDQIGGIILGSMGFGWLFIVAIILMGFVFGALGGTIGSGIRKLIHQISNNKSA
ncbi:MAG: hypothetical protein FK734_03065 [Asgard group archaeon]|nr:hypothetical protein [Asgard group archaeon]